ncbi:MAG: hypothetical protein ACREDY_00910, partial [Bradyrhizobium sp.]
MTTALDLIQDSLESIGVYAPGETVSDADARRSLVVLDDMLDSWSNESLTCFAILEQSGMLIPGQNQYTIGQGGLTWGESPWGPPSTWTAPADFDLPRPIRVINGPGAAYLTDSNNNRYPVDVVPRDYWNMIWNLTEVTSNLPNIMFY